MSKIPKLLSAISLVALSGCVSVENRAGLTPPSALCSSITATVGVPKHSVRAGYLAPKNGSTDKTVYLKEWVFTKASAGLLDMTIDKAAQKGGLKKVDYADYQQISILGFVTMFAVTVYGE